LLITDKECLDWLDARRKSVKVSIEPASLDALENWTFDKTEGVCRHNSGRFFSIKGIQVNTNWGPVKEWDQPIINQAEIGFLGILAKEIDGSLFFLMQAKIEPGNINTVQLSPTLQATRSNYLRIHEGKEPAYLKYFRNADNYKIILDQLQSEQGARFLRKRNRNIVLLVNEEIEAGEDFRWLSLAQIKRLMRHNNVVNMDTRTVISGLSFVNEFNPLPVELPISNNAFVLSSVTHEKSYRSLNDIMFWLTGLKSRFELTVRQKNLLKLRDWEYRDGSIVHSGGRFFSVTGAKVAIENREVTSWSQPLISPAQEGLIAFVCKKIHGVVHFLVQAKLECGNLDILEIAPTVQCLTGNYRETMAGTLPYLEYVLNASQKQIIYDAMQSEEGGRFLREQNRNLIVLAEDDFSEELPEKYMWITLSQLHLLMRFNNYVNVQARSLISAISFEE
jgi:oxidase EvaA